MCVGSHNSMIAVEARCGVSRTRTKRERQQDDSIKGYFSYESRFYVCLVTFHVSQE